MRFPCRLLLILLLSLGSAMLHAQDAAGAASSTPAPSPTQTLDRLHGQLEDIKTALKDKPTDTSLGDLRGTALAVQDQAGQLATTLKPQMDSLEARLGVLGPAPAKGAPAEATEVTAQRRQLDKDKAGLDAQIKQAQLLGEEGMQLAAQIAGLRRDQFQAQLASRTASPFSRAFWAEPAHSLPDDLARLRRLGSRLDDDWHDAWRPPNRASLVWLLLAAVLSLFTVRRLLELGLLALVTHVIPEGHLRRSALATGVALATALGVGLAAELFYLGLNGNGMLDPELDELARAMVQLICFTAFSAGLGRALLSVKRPSWRLPALSNQAAQGLEPFPWLLAIAALLLGLIERINATIGASLPATVATRGLIALVISGLIGMALLRLGRARRTLLASGLQPAHRPLWVGLLAIGAVLGVILTMAGVASGFIAFAFFLATQMLWTGVTVGTLYLLTQLVHDLFETLLSPQGPAGQRLQTALDLSPGTLEQTATVLSGIGRVLLFLLAIVIVLAPFGAGPKELLARTGELFGGLKLGELTIKPGAVLNAMAVFVLGLLAVRAIKRWLGHQLLPKTELDPGMQNSVVTLLGYVGGVLVFALALAALNVSLQSIAWIASALSVGIGFGLQAIVQNFISGLILLAERPVKVGDWISLDGVEGDIRRINVRATEIQLWDRSTVIVPNSQLITQNVRNVTLANAYGRVQLKLPMPLDTDAGKARQIILQVLQAHPSVLPSPAGYVQLENIDTGSMNFNCVGYVSSPRDASRVKSELLFTLLERLREARLPLVHPHERLLRTLLSPTKESVASA